MTLEWINDQIVHAIEGPGTTESVRDLAALIIVRDHWRDVSDQEMPIRTLAQVQRDLAMLAKQTQEDFQRIEDAQLWARVLEG